MQRTLNDPGAGKRVVFRAMVPAEVNSEISTNVGELRGIDIPCLPRNLDRAQECVPRDGDVVMLTTRGEDTSIE